MHKILKLILTLCFIININTKIFAVDYGSDTAVAITPVTMATGQDNIIKSFGWAKHGLTFEDAITTVTFQSAFPIAGPIDMQGGKFYLDTDLVLSNTAKFLSLGSIEGYNHMLSLSESTTNMRFIGTIGDSATLNLIARATEGNTINSVDWSYDNNYIVAGADQIGGPGNNLFIYSYINDILTKVNTTGLNSAVFSTRWHPSSYYLAIGSDRVNAELRIYSFTPPNTTSLEQSYNAGDNIYSTIWHPTGNFLASGGISNTDTITIFTFSAGTITRRTGVNKTQDISSDTLVWAPSGNGNYLASGFTTDGTNPELIVYLFNNTTPSLTSTAQKLINQSITALDWSPTGTYLAVGLSGGNNRLRIYERNISRGAASSYGYLEEATRLDETQTVKSVNWSSDGTKLSVGLENSTGTEFRFYSFSTSPTPTISLLAGVESSTNINSTKFSNDDMYIANGDSSNFVSVYKPILTGSFYFKDLNIFLYNNVLLQSPLTFEGNCSIDARGKTLELSGNASLNIKPNSTTSIKRTDLKLDNPGTFALESKSSVLKFEDSIIELSSDVTIGDGALGIDGDLVITGPYTLNYSTATTSTINEFSSLKIENEATLAIGRNPSISRQPLDFIDDTSFLILDNATLNITNSGLNIKKGKLKTFNKSIIDIDSPDNEYGLILGDGTLENDATLEIKSGSELLLKNGPIVMNTLGNENLNFFADSSKLTFSDYQSSLQVQRRLNISTGTISPKTQDNISVSDNAYLSVNNIKFVDQSTKEEFFLTGTIQNANNIILDQDDLLTLNAGNLSKTITVSRNNNTIRGVGGFTGELNLTYSMANLIFNLSPINNNNIDLNKSKIILENDSNFLRDFIFTNSGTVDLTYYKLSFGAQDALHTSTIYWQGTEGKIELNSKLSLTGTWTFRGNFVIYGNNNTLDLGSSGQIFLEGDSSVQFKDLAIQNLKNTNFKCTTNRGQITLNNCILSQTNDFNFPYGSIGFMNQNYLQAKNSSSSDFTFYYDTTQTSTIKSISNLQISNGITFKLGKKNSASTVQPLEFEDASSILDLNGCTLHVTSSGMQLLRGEMRISDNSTLDIDAANYDTGFIIGDGTTSDNDFIIRIGGGNKLIINTGKLFYNNVNSENKIIFTSLASAIRVESDLGLVAKKNLKIVNGTLLFPLADAIQTFDDSFFEQDNITHIHDTFYAVHKSKAQLKKKAGSFFPTEYYIFDTGYFYSLEGDARVPLNVEAGTTTIGGSGLISATTTIKDANASINTNSTANYQNNIILNGGTLSLDSDLKFIGNKKLSGSGIINLNNSRLSFGTDELTFSDPIYWNSSSGIDLNAKTTLSTTWTINGIYNLNGHGNILDMSSGGRIEIRPDSTLFLTDIVIKGLGHGYGRLLPLADSAQINMSNVYIELDNDYSTTIGGIYVEGPTTFGLKNYNWTFDQQASLTVDGITLWQDPLDKINYGKIKFGSGTLSKYLSLTESGTIKTCANLDIISTNTQALAIDIRHNSNTIVAIDNYIDTELDGAVRANSRNIVYNSNALLYGIKNNSNAIIKNTRDILSNSNSLLDGIKNNSNSIIAINNNIDTELAGAVRANSRNISYNSNSLLYLDDYVRTEVDGSIRANSRNIVYNSNALLNLDNYVRTQVDGSIRANSRNIIYNSNALLYGIKNNSNAIIKNTRDILSNSNSLLDGIKNNSNSIIAIDNYIDTELDGAVRANSRNISYNSNALIYGIKNNSNALIYGIKNNSNALAYGIKNNSNTIIALDNYIDTGLTGAVRANSRNISYNSNALLNLDDYIRTQVDGSIRANSRNIVYNSNAFLYGIANNSNALTYGLKNNSNALIYGIKNNSNALTYSIKNNSNALLYGIKNNSNAIIAINNNIDTELAGAVRANSRNINYNSNALLYGIKNNSNAIIKNTRDILSNSNSLLYGIKNNSNTIIALDNYIDTGLTGAVRANSRNIVYNSNALLYGIKNNSNALKYLDTYVRTQVDGSIRANSRDIVYNSNALLYGIKNNSNAIIKNTRDILSNSNSLLYGIKNNSNSIIAINNNINTELAGAVRANSRNIVYNSNALIIINADHDILAGSIRANSRNIRYNSNAILKNTQDIKHNSYAITVMDPDAFPWADKIMELETDIDSLTDRVTLDEKHFNSGITGNTTILFKTFLDSPVDLQNKTLNLFGDLEFSSNTNILSSGYLNLNNHALLLTSDLTIPNDIVLTVTTSGIIDGQGHRLIFDEITSKIVLDSHVTLTLRNVILSGLKNFGNNDASISIKEDTRTQLVFQKASLELERNFTFSKGQLFFEDDVIISSTNQFNYTSTNNAYISGNSTLFLDLESTFSFGPYSNNKNLINMADKTSKIYLNGCSLYTTFTGLQLTKGTLVVDHKNYLYNQEGLIGSGFGASSISQAIIFGDNLNPENDLSLEIMPGGSIELKTGILEYRNLNE